MAKCSKCDFKYATYEKCPNCGCENPVSMWQEMGTAFNKVVLLLVIVFICSILWPAELLKIYLFVKVLFTGRE